MAVNPRLWASLWPRDPRLHKPNHYLEMAQVAWDNRSQLPYAWRILSRGTCDGCALGTSGLTDWTLPGTHLCMVRLELLRLSTMGSLDPERLRDAAALGGLSSRELRELGRLPHPLLRRRGEPGFRAIPWNEAYDVAAGAIRAIDPQRLAVYLTSRGILNEHYYAAQKAARALGTPHVDNSARLCHAASTVAMKQMLGHGATTCSYRDLIGTDVVVLFGSNTANNQPVTMKYLYHARQRGTRVVVVNTYDEPGLRHYWVPSVPESALFGTRFADDWFAVHTGGDHAFLQGALRALEEQGGVDRGFVERHTLGFEDALSAARAASWELLERESGSSRGEMQRFAALLARARTGVLVWSMGLTQHAHGVATVKALLNVGLARGFVGREHCGLMPIRGHSGVQGGAEVGCAPIDETTRQRFEAVWGFPVPAGPGHTAAEMVAAAGRGELDVCRGRRPRRPRSRRSRCASTRTSCSPPRCWSTPRRRCWCCPPPPATSRRAVAARPPPSGASCSRPRCRGGGSAAPSPSGRCSARWRRGSAPSWRRRCAERLISRESLRFDQGERARFI